MKLKKGDKVIVISGKDKGSIGTIQKVFPKENRVIVDGVNVCKKHVKPNQMNPEGSIQEIFAPIDASNVMFYEHGGNATAGVHVHLFRYVINTQNPTWVIRDGIQVFTGRWVDQGPMGVERPCDIKALFLSNYDTNNFNNYYKFMLDTIIDSINRNSVTVVYNPSFKNDPSFGYGMRQPGWIALSGAVTK